MGELDSFKGTRTGPIRSPNPSFGHNREFSRGVGLGAGSVTSALCVILILWGELG